MTGLVTAFLVLIALVSGLSLAGWLADRSIKKEAEEKKREARKREADEWEQEWLKNEAAHVRDAEEELWRKENAAALREEEKEEERERQRVEGLSEEEAKREMLDRLAVAQPYLAADLRAMEMGPKYDPSPAYRYTYPGLWTMAEDQTPATCPNSDCRTTEYLTLVWIENREDAARFTCPNCNSVWLDPVWATEDAIAWVTSRLSGPEWETWVADAPADVPPATYELVEKMRREHNTGKRKK